MVFGAGIALSGNGRCWQRPSTIQIKIAFIVEHLGMRRSQRSMDRRPARFVMKKVSALIFNAWACRLPFDFLIPRSPALR
jgi:hypothetical protein